MSVASAEMAARAFGVDGLKLATQSPGTFARAHGIEVSDAIPIISREIKLRKSNKLWRK